MSVALGAVACLALGAMSPASAVAVEPSAAGGRTCHDVNEPVHLERYGEITISGELCWLGSSAPSTVQVLVSGTTYNRVYWDFTYQPERYSYARAANKAGYATLVLDRPGTGKSTHPPGALLSNSGEAGAIHQVIQALRAGKLGGTRFAKVVIVGHSYGSIVTWYEAGTYRDVDAVLITGSAHGLTPEGAAATGTSLYPAAVDPKFAGRIIDPSYLTTIPGTRKGFFYRPDADPGVISEDERTKDVAGAGEVADIALGLVSGMSNKINVPVLLAIGRDDKVFCGIGGVDCRSADTVLAAERKHYSSSPRVEAWVAPRAAHNLNTSADSTEFFRVANDWLDRVLKSD